MSDTRVAGRRVTDCDEPKRAAASAAVDPAVALHGVSKRFGAVHAVRGIDLTVPSGEIVAFLGPNGAGKTSTIDMMLGLSVPTTGTVQVYGLAPSEAVRRGMVSAVMQTGGLLHDLTVRETVNYIACLFVRHRPVGEVLDRAGIGDIADRRVGKCSGGEQQRLRFALALLPDPALLILDEPTQGMDVAGRRAFWDAIRSDARQGRTVFFATHYLEEADAYADRVVLLRDGRIVADGTAAAVKNRVGGRLVRATWPDATAEAIQQIPSATAVEWRGAMLLVRSPDADQVARYLLTHTTAHDLEITPSGLEEAFLALTGTADDPAVRSPEVVQ